MTRIARWCFEHRRTVVAAWVVALIALLGISRVAGSDFNSDLSLSNTDSQAAVDLLDGTRDTGEFRVAGRDGQARPPRR